MKFLSVDMNQLKLEKFKAMQSRLYLVVLTLLLAIIVTIIWILSVIEFKNIQQVEHHYSVAPDQIRLSLGQSPRQMVVTWNTDNRTEQSKVWYGVDSLDQVAEGVQTEFTDGGPSRRTNYVHRVYLSNLKPNTTYKYNVGSNNTRSEQYSFRTFPDYEPLVTDWSPTIAVFGDMSKQTGQTYQRLQNEVAQGLVDMVMHVGDLFSELDTDSALKPASPFKSNLEPISAYVPYQVCPGNNEQPYNFSKYNKQFAMHSAGSDDVNNHFWSYDIGPAHIIAFSTEFHFQPQSATDQIMSQFRWLEDDLKKANQPEQRSKVPWIITMAHRPFYSEVQGTSQDSDILREGNESIPGLEDLFFKYGVDLNLFGHLPSYERMWPVFEGVVYNGSTDSPYTNPKAPVHITTGTGAKAVRQPKLPELPNMVNPLDQMNPFDLLFDERPDYSAFATPDAGFTRLGLLNGTHLRVQQISDLMNDVVDDFFLVKDSSKPAFPSIFDGFDGLMDNMNLDLNNMNAEMSNMMADMNNMKADLTNMNTDTKFNFGAGIEDLFANLKLNKK